MVRVNWFDIKRHIKEVIILFIPVVAYSIYKLMDKIMLGNMTTYMQVGYYENAGKIINIPISQQIINVLYLRKDKKQLNILKYQ